MVQFVESVAVCPQDVATREDANCDIRVGSVDDGQSTHVLSQHFVGSFSQWPVPISDHRWAADQFANRAIT